jgi:hypothetical protein
VKTKRAILSVLSVLLVFFLLIGSTGVTVVIKSCKSCGISVNTQLFGVVASNTTSCCGPASHCSTDSTESVKSVCCTTTTEKIKITHYTQTVKVNFSAIPAEKPAHNIPSTPALKEHSVIPLYVHNKHGGQEVIISHRQLLI